jgi:hypothetical protein
MQADLAAVRACDRSRHHEEKGVAGSAASRAKQVSERVDAKASGLKGADTEWLDDLDINRVQQHLDRSCYYRSQFRVSDYYPMAVDLQVQALQRFARGERSTKIAQVFRNGKCGCWLMNLRQKHH